MSPQNERQILVDTLLAKNLGFNPPKPICRIRCQIHVPVCKIHPTCKLPIPTCQMGPEGPEIPY